MVQPSTTTLRAVATTFAALAVITTSARLAYRRKRGSWWWDDTLALFSLIFQVFIMVALWIRTDTPSAGPLHQSREVRVIAYWCVTLNFTSLLWSSRLSILLSVLRIVPPMMRLRRVVQACLVFFVMMWIALLVQKVHRCAPNHKWPLLPEPQCPLGHTIALTELTSDFVSDAILIAAPIRVIWGVFTRRERYLLFAIFSSSVLTTSVSIVHAVYVLTVAGKLEALTANVEASTALIVANGAVCITFLYRRFHGDSIEDIERSSTYDDGSGALRRRGLATTIKFATVASAASQLDETNTTFEGSEEATFKPKRKVASYPPDQEPALVRHEV